MSIKEFLESKGYRMWKEDAEKSHSTMYFQKRVDDIYTDAPVCACNDKLFINIEVWTMRYNGVHTSCTVGMVHENQNDEWCDIKIYSLTEDQLKAKLEEYEDKVVNMWEVFND